MWDDEKVHHNPTPTFRAADRTSAADAVFPLTNTYMGVLRSGKLVSSESMSLVGLECQIASERRGLDDW